MYQAYWGLSESPFRGHQSTRFFHQGPPQEEALARLHFLVDEHRGCGLLLGESGSGRSFTLEVFARKLGRIGRQSALVNVAQIDAHEFLWLLSGALGIEVTATASQFRLWRAVADHLAANRYQQISTILLLDDVDLARLDVLDQLVRLLQVDANGLGLLTLVLAARYDRLQRLGHELLELAELRIDLEGWQMDDTADFIKRSLADAGRTTPIFSQSALARLHEVTGGIPRRVKQVADLALLAGAGENQVHIEAPTIDAVFQELGVVISASSPAISGGR